MSTDGSSPADEYARSLGMDPFTAAGVYSSRMRRLASAFPGELILYGESPEGRVMLHTWYAGESLPAPHEWIALDTVSVDFEPETVPHEDVSPGPLVWRTRSGDDPEQRPTVDEIATLLRRLADGEGDR